MGLKPGVPDPTTGPGEENGVVFGITGADVGLKAETPDPITGLDDGTGMLL